MEDVFVYFVAIGAGISFGLTIGAIPALLAYRWIKKREGGNHHVYKKART